MLKRELITLHDEKVRGGNGILHGTVLGTPEECHGHVMQFRHNLLEPGNSIGYHVHEINTEFYYILSGNPTANDNGTEVVLQPGDVLVTGNGDGHSLANNTDKPVEFINLIVYR